MKYVAALILAFAMTGCATWQPEKETVVEQVYIIRVPPAETMKLPEAVPDIDADKADQGEVARWLLNKEDYKTSLEDKLKAIAKFFVDEQKKLEKK